MNRFLITSFALLAYWTGLDALFYWLNRKSKRTITFHNVLPDDGFVWNCETDYSLSESLFRKVVRELAKRWRFSTDLFDANTVTLSFDDGNANQYEIAAEILREEGDIPAVLFYAHHDEDWRKSGPAIDKLLFWLAYAPNAARARADGARNRFEADVDTRGRSTIEWLDTIFPFDRLYASKSNEYLRLRFDGIKNDQIHDLRKRGWIVGWHTRTHFPLAYLDEASQRKEMMPPVDMRGMPFSYPYGETKRVNESAIKVAEEIGFPCAVANTEYGGPLHGRFFLPRFNLPPLTSSYDVYLLHLQLSGLKYFIKKHKLLPVVTNGDN